MQMMNLCQNDILKMLARSSSLTKIKLYWSFVGEGKGRIWFGDNRDNLNNREEQTVTVCSRSLDTFHVVTYYILVRTSCTHSNTPLNKYYFNRTKKDVRCCPKFLMIEDLYIYKALFMNIYRGPRSLQSDCFKCTHVTLSVVRARATQERQI